MQLPDNVNARWIDTLADDQLIKAEAALHAVFNRQESTEKARAGERYMLLQGPAELVNAWQRWLMVNNETRSRGLIVHRRA
ncbi:MAG TPA: hypothetical protein VG818_02310 [Gemmatimonadaceae bacterium]|jgi:hypothetical protein|nr:hypothetical protein [Gemmatimonadaceae bacterium]